MGFEGAIQEPGSDVTSLATRFVTHQKSSYWCRCYSCYKKRCLSMKKIDFSLLQNFLISLSCWNFQRVFPWLLKHSTWKTSNKLGTTRYYRGAAAAVIVFDITSRESFDAAKSWVAELQNTDPDEKRQGSTPFTVEMCEQRYLEFGELLSWTRIFIWGWEFCGNRKKNRSGTKHELIATSGDRLTSDLYQQSLSYIKCIWIFC